MAAKEEEGNTRAMRWPIRRNREPGTKRPRRMLAWALVLGFLAVVLGTLNVVGGFVVTDRMLEMFKSKKKKTK